MEVIHHGTMQSATLEMTLGHTTVEHCFVRRAQQGTTRIELKGWWSMLKVQQQGTVACSAVHVGIFLCLLAMPCSVSGFPVILCMKREKCKLWEWAGLDGFTHHVQCRAWWAIDGCQSLPCACTSPQGVVEARAVSMRPGTWS